MAFYKCSGLLSVIIGNNVKSIEEGAFEDCSKLENVYCWAERVPSTNRDAFKDSYPQYMTLYVPAGSINDYKNKLPWSEFGSIKSLDESTDVTLSYSNLPSIHNDGSVLNIQGAEEGTQVQVYNLNGTLAGEGISRNGYVTVNTNLQPGSVAIIKIGQESVKVAIK